MLRHQMRDIHIYIHCKISYIQKIKEIERDLLYFLYLPLRYTHKKYLIKNLTNK